MTDDDRAPLLRVLTPSATPEDVAVILAVLASTAGPAEPAPRPRSQWAAPRRMHAPPLPHGPGAWRASGLPR